MIRRNGATTRVHQASEPNPNSKNPPTELPPPTIQPLTKSTPFETMPGMLVSVYRKISDKQSASTIHRRDLAFRASRPISEEIASTKGRSTNMQRRGYNLDASAVQLQCEDDPWYLRMVSRELTKKPPRSACDRRSRTTNQSVLLTCAAAKNTATPANVFSPKKKFPNLPPTRDRTTAGEQKGDVQGGPSLLHERSCTPYREQFSREGDPILRTGMECANRWGASVTWRFDVFAGSYEGLTLTFRFLTLVLNLLLLSATTLADLSEDQLSHFRRERSEAAKKWAPLIFLHPNERFFPSAVHTFLKNVAPRELPPSERPTEPPVLVPMSRSLDTHNLPEGEASEHVYLFAPYDAKCKNCPLADFLYGTKPSAEYSPPVYAIINSCLPNHKPFRNPRNISPPPSWKHNQRRFRFRNRRGRFSLRGRRKNFSGGTTRLTPPYTDSYTSVSTHNSFPLSTSHDSTPFETLNRRESHNFILDDKADFSLEATQLLPPISPPSTTLLPPRTLSFSSTQAETESTGDYLDVASSSIRTEYTEFVSVETSPLADHDVIVVTSDGIERGNFSSLPSLASTDPVESSAPTITPDAPSVSSFESATKLNGIPRDESDTLRGHKFTVTYWMFYPYSQGKEVCTSRLWLLGRVFKPRLRNKCYGETITLNSHVGDWEHVSIYFEDGFPQLMYVSTHVYGAFYQYNPIKNIFMYRGKDTRMGLPLNPKYPSVIKMDGTHPVLYSALGSHGLWGSPGVHRYESLLPLEDRTEAGTPWKSWSNIDIIDYRDLDQDRPDRQWLNFHGRWGNPSTGCYKGLFGSCDLANGPTGIPLKRENFPCHLPQHPTFFPKD